MIRNLPGLTESIIEVTELKVKLNNRVHKSEAAALRLAMKDVDASKGIESKRDGCGENEPQKNAEISHPDLASRPLTTVDVVDRPCNDQSQQETGQCNKSLNVNTRHQ